MSNEKQNENTAPKQDKAPKALPAFEVRKDGSTVQRKPNGLVIVNHPGTPR